MSQKKALPSAIAAPRSTTKSPRFGGSGTGSVESASIGRLPPADQAMPVSAENATATITRRAAASAPVFHVGVRRLRFVESLSCTGGPPVVCTVRLGRLALRESEAALRNTFGSSGRSELLAVGLVRERDDRAAPLSGAVAGAVVAPVQFDAEGDEPGCREDDQGDQAPCQHDHDSRIAARAFENLPALAFTQRAAPPPRRVLRRGDPCRHRRSPAGRARGAS